MVSKVNPSSPQVASPEVLRNVVLVGSAGSGKTTLFAQLVKARVPGYRGEKEDAERAAALTLASFASSDVVVNLLDAPGHPDYVGELRAGLRAADAAVFVVSAADGIDPITASLWRECEAASMPRAIAVTKLDTGHTTFADVVADCQARFGDGVQAGYLPLLKGNDLVGNLSLITMRCHDYSGGECESSDAADALLEEMESYRTPLLEAIISESEDDDLMERYLEGDDLARDEVLGDLEKAIAHATFFPVLPVQSTTGVGVEELLGMIEAAFPWPGLHALPAVTTPTLEDFPALRSDPALPLVAEVIRTTSDPFAGRLSMVRVFQGTLRPDATVHISGHRAEFENRADTSSDHDADDRVGPVTAPAGVELAPRTQAMAGEIVFVAKLSRAETSDTLSDPDHPALIEPWWLPDPLLPLALRAASRKDDDKLAAALQRLGVEDTTVRVERGADDQLVMWTMGQAHSDLLVGRLTDRYGVQVETEPLKIALRETFVQPSSGHGRHVKQSGGHGQFAVCDIDVEPLERGAGFEFVDKVVGGAVPRQFIPSVEKGVRHQLEKGVVAGYPMVDVRVTLHDGKSHPVDSSDMAFQMAGALALREAAAGQACTLLEPYDDVTIMVDAEYQGAVMTDLAARRGHVVGTDMHGSQAVVHARIPVLELSRYAIDLRGLAHGSGTFTRSPSGYEPMPPELADKAIARTRQPAG